MQRSKAETYIGFCIKSGKLTCGFNAVALQKKGVFLLILCASASENARGEALKLKRRFNCELLIACGRTLEEITGKPNVKLAAVRDTGLANAILTSGDENFKIYSGGNG